MKNMKNNKSGLTNLIIGASLALVGAGCAGQNTKLNEWCGGEIEYNAAAIDSGKLTRTNEGYVGFYSVSENREQFGETVKRIDTDGNKIIISKEINDYLNR